MKKSILAVALFGFYAASAQHTEFFDTQMKLRKKKEATQKINPGSQPAFPGNKMKLSAPFVAPQKPALSGEIVPGKLIMQLANGGKAYALPQDGMPCIVPDMNQFTMPNGAGNRVQAYRHPGPGAIPNPAVRPIAASGKMLPAG